MKSIMTIMIPILVICYNLDSQQNLVINEKTHIISSLDSMPRMDSIELFNAYHDFDGYLIIKLDTNSKYKVVPSKGKNSYFLRTEVFWVNSLDDIDKDSLTYCYFDLFEFILETASLTVNFMDTSRIISYMKDFYYFNRANKDIQKTYLYYGYLEPTAELFKSSGDLWTVNSLKSSFLILKTNFVTAILKFKFTNFSKLVFMPISKLKELKPISEEEALKHALTKSKLQVELEE